MHGETALMLQLLTCFVPLTHQVRSENTGSTLKHEILQNSSPHVSRTVAEFRSRMLQTISTFPASRQCAILQSILEESGEGLSPIVEDLIYKPHYSLPCLRDPSPPGSLVNTSALCRATNVEVSEVFDQLPQAYQCKIIFDVTNAVSGKTPRFRASTRSLRVTMATLRKELPLTDITSKCATVMSRPETPQTYVRLVVRLRKGLPLETWLRRFKSKFQSLYVRHASRSGKISEIVTGWKRNKNGDRIPIIPRDKFIVKIQGDLVVNDKVVVVNFSFLSRLPSGVYTAVDNEEVVAAFRVMRRSQLNQFLQAEVIGWSSFAQDSSGRVHRAGKKNQNMSDVEIVRLYSFFPKYLARYFRSMSGSGRCYVLHQLSSYLKLDLLQVEKLYHSFELLQKRHFCSKVTKDSKLRTSKYRLPSVWDKLDQYCRIVPKTWSVTTARPTTTTAEHSTIVRETRPFNSMEIVMFALLGFLCVLIMVFVANCVVFTVKAKQLNTDYNGTMNVKKYSETRDETSKFPDGGDVEVNISENPMYCVSDKVIYSSDEPGYESPITWLVTQEHDSENYHRGRHF